ncbi:ABC transporter ATP-binding protein, partial [Rhizobium ruizarguesonis]
ILVPSAGTLSLLGRTPHLKRMDNALEIGVVFGQRSQLWWDLPLVDSFTLHQLIYDIPVARYADNLRRFSELLDLTPARNNE